MGDFKKNDLKKLATQAKISIADSDHDSAIHSLQEILQFLQQLNNANRIDEDVDDSSYNINLREDIAGEPDDRDKLLENAPDAEQSMFRVPKVIEE